MCHIFPEVFSARPGRSSRAAAFSDPTRRSSALQDILEYSHRVRRAPAGGRVPRERRRSVTTKHAQGRFAGGQSCCGEQRRRPRQQEQGAHVPAVAGGRRVRPAPFLPGQGLAGRAVVVHVRRVLRVRLAQGRVLHRRVRGRRQQGRELHEESRLHGPRARKGEFGCVAIFSVPRRVLNTPRVFMHT